MKPAEFIAAGEAFARKHPQHVIELSDPTGLIEGAFSTDRYTRDTARRRMRVAALEALEEADRRIEAVKAQILGREDPTPSSRRAAQAARIIELVEADLGPIERSGDVREALVAAILLVIGPDELRSILGG